MANQVEILSLNIDTNQLIQKLSQTKAQIEQLQASQKSLTQAGQSSSQQFVQQAAQLKNLQTQYNGQLNVVTQLTAAKKDAENVADSLNQALANESSTIAQATENNKQLRAIRNQLNVTTEEGAAAIELINKKLDENTEFIKENVSSYEQQKMAIGDYSNQIQDALSNLNPFNGGIAGFTERANAAGGAGNLLTQSFKGMATGLMGVTKAGLAFLATPVGAAIGVLALAVGAVVGAFKFMTASMNSTEEGSQKLAKITGAITGIFQGLFKVVKPLGEFIGTVFIKAFETAAEVADKAMKVISGGLKLLGFDGASKAVDEFSGAIKESSKAASDLAVAQGELDKAQRKAQLTQLEYQKQAEKLRQIRDDESLSIAERTKANEQLGAVLKQQLADELAIAEKALIVANLRIKAEGKSKEALDAQAEALTGIADIQERITGQESEQLANLNSLRKEAADKAKELNDKAIAARQKAVDDAIQKNKDELDLFLASQGIKKKSLEDELKLAEDVSKKRIAILDKEYKAGKISKEAYEAAKLTISNEYAQKQMEVTISDAQRELDRYKRSLEQKKVDDKYYTEEKLLAQQSENNSIAIKEQEFQALRLAQGQINQQEYEDAVEEIKENTRIKNEEAEKLRAEAKKEKDIVDLENQRILDEENFLTDYELETERERIRYEAELAAVEKTGADTTLIKKKHSANQKKIDEALQESKIAAMGATLGIVAGLLGEESAMGKTAALAQALINTYQGITAGVKLGYPMAIPAVAAATITGFAAVNKITSTKVSKFADGGQVPVLSSGVINNGSNVLPLSNGDDTLAYVKQGEVILNSQQQLRAGGSMFFKSIGVPGFSGGGYVGGNSNQNIQSGYKIDMDLLAQKIGEQVGKANLNLPTPVVEVDTITSAQNNKARIEAYANF